LDHKEVVPAVSAGVDSQLGVLLAACNHRYTGERRHDEICNSIKNPVTIHVSSFRAEMDELRVETWYLSLLEQPPQGDLLRRTRRCRFSGETERSGLGISRIVKVQMPTRITCVLS
jgi:hypothetical protein